MVLSMPFKTHLSQTPSQTPQFAAIVQSVARMTCQEDLQYIISKCLLFKQYAWPAHYPSMLQKLSEG